MDNSKVYSVKGSVIKAHGYFTGSGEMLRDNNLILITAAGVISGKYSEIIERDPADGNISGEFQRNVMLEISKKLGETEEIDRLYDETTTILLSDVKINNCGTMTNLPSLLVFADQVIGVSVGNLTRDNQN